jgi:hypothetical protein
MSADIAMRQALAQSADINPAPRKRAAKEYKVVGYERKAFQRTWRFISGTGPQN